MTEEKTRRMVTGIVVAVTTLIVTLLIILVSQIVTVSVQNNRMDELDAENARLEQLLEGDKTSLEYYQSLEAQKDLALQYGFIQSNK